MAGRYVVTGACECGQPSVVVYRDSRGAPFGEACTECNEWRPRSARHQCEAIDAETRYVRAAVYNAVGAPLVAVLDAIVRMREAMRRAVTRL